MGMFITIIGAIMAVLVVILIHEAGHFAMAKLFGVKVLRFSIGFGKPLWSYTSASGTEYVLGLLPLGGYVKLLDDRELHVSQKDSQRAYNRQPLFARMAIVLAGPVTNFILAILVFWIIFLIGVSYIKPVIGKITPNSIAETAGLKTGETIKRIEGKEVQSWQQVLTSVVENIGAPTDLTVMTQAENSPDLQTHLLALQNWKLVGNQPDPLGSLGIAPFQPKFPAIIEKILPNSPAARNGLQANDQIIALNNQRIEEWPEIAEYIQKHPDQEIALTIQRGQQTTDLNIQLDRQKKQHQWLGYLGVEVKLPQWPENMVLKPQYSILSAWQPALQQTWNLIAFNWVVLGKMLHGKISLQTLGGPITIFRSAGQASHAGIQAYLNFIGFISVTLGFINILPIPGLDGGHFLFQVIEGIIRRPIPEKYQLLLLRIGIALIVFLILQGTINDFMRLF